MIIDNKYMLNLFCTADEVLYYNQCKDISLASEDYKVKTVIYVAENEAMALYEHISMKVYYDDVILLGISSANEQLIKEALDIALGLNTSKEPLELRTTFPQIFSYPIFAKPLELKEPEENSFSPVYYIHRKEELLSHPVPDEVDVHLATDKDYALMSQDMTNGKIDREIFDGAREDYVSDIPSKIFFLTVDGATAGYLRAENGFSNIYEIGWLYVVPEYRGHHYSVYLTESFSEWCFENGFIPQYGFAINEESRKIAEQCGYKSTHESMYVRLLS